MSYMEPSPQTTLVILLGASEWPRANLKGSLAFALSASKIRDYFSNPRQFELPPENWLDLFDKHQSSPDEVDQAIGDFLDTRIAIMKQAGTPARDLLFYYIGHGVFAPGYDQAYHLAISCTRDGSLRASAVSMAALAETLKVKARRLRRLVILDCCFAAESFKYMQSAPDQAAIRQTISAFEEKTTGSGFPEKGTALLCSSGHKEPSLILRDESGTMFSEALVRALSLGNKRQPGIAYLSLYELKALTEDVLESLAEDAAPRPFLSSPDQSDGDVATVPLFPNFAASSEQPQTEKSQLEISRVGYTTPLPLGTILDRRFKIVQVLSQGGMTNIYKVEQVGKPGKFWAVKQLLVAPNATGEECEAAVERFDNEIDILSNLKHPRIPSLIRSFEERGSSFFLMEFAPGRSLEWILADARGPLDEAKVIYWMMQVCEVLGYIHSCSPPIILCDLEPGNIMVTPDNEVQLIVSDIARRFDPNKRTDTENLYTISFSYTSPEHMGALTATAPDQKRSAQNPGKLVLPDARSDIYSLGATMYHLLTNYEPDVIQTPKPGSMLAKNPRLRTVQIGGRTVCPVEQVVIKAMQWYPNRRFQSADAMRVALQYCLSKSHFKLPNPSEVVCSLGHKNPVGSEFCDECGEPFSLGPYLGPGSK